MSENYNGQRYTNDSDFVTAKLGINHSANVTASDIAAATKTGHSATDAFGKGLTPGLIGSTRVLGERTYRLVRVASANAIVAGLGVGAVNTTALVATDFPITAIGAMSLVIDTPSATINGFAGDLLCITDDDGQGFAYKISSNTATDSDGNCRVSLLDPIADDLDAGTVGVILGSVCKDVVAGGEIGEIAGILQTTVGSTTGGLYAWVQTKGPCVCIADATIAVGVSVTIASTGQVSPHVAGDGLHGVCIVAGTSTVPAVIMLNIL